MAVLVLTAIVHHGSKIDPWRSDQGRSH